MVLDVHKRLCVYAHIHSFISFTPQIYSAYSTQFKKPTPGAPRQATFKEKWFKQLIERRQIIQWQ